MPADVKQLAIELIQEGHTSAAEALPLTPAELQEAKQIAEGKSLSESRELQEARPLHERLRGQPHEPPRRADINESFEDWQRRINLAGELISEGRDAEARLLGLSPSEIEEATYRALSEARQFFGSAPTIRKPDYQPPADRADLARRLRG